MDTRKLTFLLLLMVTLTTVSVLAVQPFGADVTSVSNETAPADTAQGHNAIAGNVSEITVFAYTTTQAWQGYYGNVSGTIQLADASDDVMYNWSLADPEGEVYASVNTTVNWTDTACATNATDTPFLENYYGITDTDVDGVDETFFGTWASNHDEFYVNNIQIAANDCELSTKVYSDTTTGVDQEFEEVILKGGSDEYIFTAIIEESAVLGFDGRDHDFEMLVLEDGHGTDTAITAYYFYVELE